MQIKYLKNAPLGQMGDIDDIPSDQAQVLIILGIAEALTDKKAKAKKINKTQELDLDNEPT